MKIRETREAEGFGGSKTTWVQVRELKDGEELPKGAEQVPDDTKTFDWDVEDLRLARGKES